MNRILLPLVVLHLSAGILLAGNWFGSGPWANGTFYPGQLDGRYFANVYNNLGGTFSRVSTTNSYFTTNQVTTTVVSNVGIVLVTNTVTTNVITGPLLETNTVITGSVVSGVVSFGIRDGSPAFASPSGVTPGATGTNNNSTGAIQSLALDSSLNNFLVYVNGDVYVGSTSANVNPESKTVSGILANGVGRNIYEVFSNTGATNVLIGSDVSVEVIALPSATASGYFNANVNNNKSPYTFAGGGTIAIATSVGGRSEIDGQHNFALNGIKTSGNSASAFPQISTAANPQQ